MLSEVKNLVHEISQHGAPHVHVSAIIPLLETMDVMDSVHITSCVNPV